jgi:hypothetical protein
MVVVLTGEHFQGEESHRWEILFEYLFPSADPGWATARSLVFEDVDP